MKALVLYDSKFGNTRQIAEAIGLPLSAHYDVSVQSVAETTAIPQDIDLLVIGGPTHAHGISQPVQQFLSRVPGDVVRGTPVATFDTRFQMPKLLVGAASEGIAKRLRTQGARLVSEPESFYVTAGEGPLADGEVERAGAWARQLVETAVPVG